MVVVSSLRCFGTLCYPTTVGQSSLRSSRSGDIVSCKHISDAVRDESSQSPPEEDQHNADRSAGIQGSRQYICTSSEISVAAQGVTNGLNLQLYLVQKEKRRRLIRYWNTNPTIDHGI